MHGDSVRLEKMLAYIHEHFAEKITLDGLAAAGGVSRRTCGNLFQKYLKTTPMEFLNGYRLRKSIGLMRTTDVPLCEIGKAVGFSGASYYAEMFRKYFGESPSEYRRKIGITPVLRAYTVPRKEETGGFPMLVTMEYRRDRAVEYAKRWAFSRNPLFENYTGIGGDCTNFVSQAIYAGSCVMNYTPTFGWYYLSPTNRAPAWTGVEYFYNFMTSNEGIGPYATETDAGGLLPGDVIQLGRRTMDGEGYSYYHTLLVVGEDASGYTVAAHSDDAYGRPLATYRYDRARFLRMEGVRMEIPDLYEPACFRDFLDGASL